jgi:hypothetical protein
MQMQIGTIGFGIGIPKTKVQLGAANIAKFYIRQGLYDKNPARLNVQDLFSIGGKSGTFIFTGIRTKWFELDPAKSHWAMNTNLLIGTKVQIFLSGIVGKWGKVDFTLKQLDMYNNPKTLVERCCIDVEGGFQFSDMKLQGRVSFSNI